MSCSLEVDIEKWPLKSPFVIARGSRNETETVTVTLSDGRVTGRGEAVASPRYDQTSRSLVAEIEAFREMLENGLDREQLQRAMPVGPARNAIDAAMWDLDAKRTHRDVGQISGLGWPEGLQTVQTISILPPDEMGKQARTLANFPALKVKLDAEQICERIAVVHENAPDARWLVDANESWTIGILRQVAPELAGLGVVMIEQPLPSGDDQWLQDYSSPLPLFADESCHSRADLPGLKNKYHGVNIKLDKTGGLTEALALREEATDQGFEIMVGCMLGTSLGIAPALFAAIGANYVDVDPPALLAKDREHALKIESGAVSRLSPALWGGAV
ncbi:MAG: N-acetyl-D-Glu racemase DgcA [Pseudomonadota bacterium]